MIHWYQENFEKKLKKIKIEVEKSTFIFLFKNMNYITKEEFKKFFAITTTDDDILIEQLIKDAWFYFDLGNDLTIRDTTWRQRSYNRELVNLKNYPINTVTSIKVVSREWSEIANLTSTDYYIDWKTINVYIKGHFLDFSANIWYFPISTIPEWIKSLIRSITKVFYDEYKTNTSSSEIREKTIWRFKLSYFKKKVEKTWLYDIIETVRTKYWIVKTTWEEVQFYMV